MAKTNAHFERIIWIVLDSVGIGELPDAADYGDAQRTARQLQAAADSRSIVDQAKGMLMQASGCTADEALQWLRRVSQERNVRVDDLARAVIESGGTDTLKSSPAR